ncbi:MULTISPECIES: TAL effector repeat-containing protein [Mycetohabitans]|nr:MULTISPECIES: TAL effector repeat-containing protein [Mycetohabitans]
MLSKRGFSQADIVKIACNGGAQALYSVLDVEPTLRERGFSRVDIVKIAGNNGGA